MNDIELLYNKARKAYESGDKETTYKTYKDIYKMDSKSLEAEFFIIYFDAMKATMKDFWSTSISVMNIERIIFASIKKKITDNNQPKAVEFVFNALCEVSKKFTHDTKHAFAKADQSVRDEFISEYVSTLSVASEMLYSCGDDLVSVYGDKYYSYAISAWKDAIKINSSYVKYVINKDEHLNTLDKYAKKIQKVEKEYVLPEFQKCINTNTNVKTKIKNLFGKLKHK